MKGRRPTNSELDAALSSAMDTISSLRSERDELLQRVDSQDRAIASLQQAPESVLRKMAYYENPNSPPSADSLEWKERKRQKARERKDGNGPPKGKPGGRIGHKGTSRRHKPEGEVSHGFGRDAKGNMAIPRCPCGHERRYTGMRVRDIVDIRPIEAYETRHKIGTAKCGKCGSILEAESGLPRNGSYGKGVIGMMSEMRAARVPLELIPKAVKGISGLVLAKSTVVDMMARVGDALEEEAESIVKTVEEGDHAGIDETGMPLDGKDGWAWIIQSGKNIAIKYSKSRGCLVLDRHMDRFDGVATTDGFAVYKRFDRDGKHQICWAHELRNARHEAEKTGAVEDTRRLYEDLLWIYAEAKRWLEYLPNSVRLRHTMNQTLSDILDGYRGTGDKRLQKLVARLDRCLPLLFTFLEYQGVEPTNNSSERALRYVVVFRKISGQIKGGWNAMKRMSNFVTCVLTWRAHGKCVAEEVARLV